MPTTNDHKQLHEMIRLREAALAARHFPDQGHILEVGAGGGLQAVYFTDNHYTVMAIDVAESIHIKNANFPVQVYDGHTIPFPDDSFDIVFSSNVLEHIPWCEESLCEMGRVLKADGVMVHVVPSSQWRFWTSVMHYGWLIKAIGRYLRPATGTAPATHVESDSRRTERRSLFHLLRLALLPTRHGERGNWITELYFFSPARWRRSFQTANLEVVAVEKSQLFYTGYGIPGSRVKLDKRESLARILGSSSLIYVVKKA